jgi:spore germination protein GerM
MAQRTTGAIKPRQAPAKKSGKGIGCLIWLLILLVTLLLFVLSWDKIQETMRSTGFVDILPGQSTGSTVGAQPAPLKPESSLADETSSPATTVVVSPSGSTTTAGSQTAPGSTAAPATTGAAQPNAMTDDAPRAVPVQPSQPVAGTQAATEARPARPASPASPVSPASEPATTAMELVRSTRVASLFFIRVGADGIISRHEVKRTIGVSEYPLTDALNALLTGPTVEELNRDFITLIPAGTRLLSVQVLGSTAHINFNEAFMYNQYGIEGYGGQLKQIVFTATSFPTVKDVQILIEGRKLDYLGGEGVYIGKPLSRSSF